MVASCSLEWGCSSSSTRGQSISRFGPSMNPSSDTDIICTIFLMAFDPMWPGPTPRVSPMTNDAEDLPDYSDLRALYVNCTLKRSPEQSHTQGLADRSIAVL